jgi:hypothetical protein
MPLISKFYGILIYMYWGDHAPPHFHAEYGEFEALIEIETLKIYKGELPKRALRLVMEWAEQHKEELKKDWELVVNDMQPQKIEPLQ